MTRTAVSVVICMFIFGCSADEAVHNAKPAHDDTSTEQYRQWLIGRWLGKSRLDDGRKRLWLTERTADGKFEVTFRTYTDSGIEEQVEVGLWGVEENIYFTITTGWLYDEVFSPADMTKHYFYDAYEIVHLDGSSLEYLSMGTVARYELEKVDKAYELPDR